MIIFFRNVFLNIHIWSGFIALLCFWTIVCQKKGSQLHKKFGKVYFFFIWMLFISSIINTFMVISSPSLLQPDSNTKLVYIYYSFLFLASYLCFSPTLVGLAAFFRNSINMKKICKFGFCILITQLIFAALVMCVSIIYQNYFLLLFSTIFTGHSVWRDYKNLNNLFLNAANYVFVDRLKIHINSLIASGIALHIGFAAGGPSIRYFKSTQSTQYLLFFTTSALVFMLIFEKRIYIHLIKKYSIFN